MAEGERFVRTIAALSERTRREKLPSGIVLQTQQKQTRRHGAGSDRHDGDGRRFQGRQAGTEVMPL